MTRHRLRKKLPLLGTLAGLTLAFAAYVFGLAYVQSELYAYYDFGDLIEPRLIDATIFAWLIYFCSSIGSFLNVVAWRMPRGEGIGGRSRCPRCANTLKTRDNLPILGWISLGGRCRFCGLPISRRYPIVEAMVGISLTLVGIAELYSLSLPGQSVHPHGGPLWSPQVSPTVLVILCYHTIALSTLWAMALIRIDGSRLPTRLLIFAIVVVIVPMLAYPTIMVVPWQTHRPTRWFPDGLYVDAVMRVITALVAAALFGRVLAKGLCPSADLKLDPLGRGTARLVDLIAMLAVPAIVIGWQSMPAFVLGAAALSYPLRPLLNTLPINDDPKGPAPRRGAMEAFAFALPFALVLHLLFWRVLWESRYWPSDQSDPSVMIGAALLVLVVPLFLKDPVSAAAVSVPADPEPLVEMDSTQPDEQPPEERSTDELPNDQGDGEPDHGNQGRDHSPSP